MRSWTRMWTVALWAAAATVNAADLSPGMQLFERRCAGCHALDNDRQGPRLRGVYGRKAASLPKFQYSDALKSTNLTWGATSLDRWLSDPEKLAPGNDMAFQVMKPEERAQIIAFLREISK